MERFGRCLGSVSLSAAVVLVPALVPAPADAHPNPTARVLARPIALGGLASDDVLPPPPPRPLLTADPAQLERELSGVLNEKVTITNDGDAATGALTPIEDSSSPGADPAARVDLAPSDCEAGLEPGEACTVLVTVTPLHTGGLETLIGYREVPGEVRISTLAAVRIPVNVTITPTPGGETSDRPTPGGETSDKPTSGGQTSDSRATGSATSSPPPSSGGPGGLPTWLLSAPFLPLLGFLAAAVALGVALMVSRAQLARGRRRASPQPPPTARPQVRVRPGPRRDLVALPEEPVLTLVVAAPPASTTVTEDQR